MFFLTQLTWLSIISITSYLETLNFPVVFGVKYVSMCGEVTHSSDMEHEDKGFPEVIISDWLSNTSAGVTPCSGLADRPAL